MRPAEAAHLYFPALLCLGADCSGPAPFKCPGTPSTGVYWKIELTIVHLRSAGVLAMLLQGRSGTPSMAEPTEAPLILLAIVDLRQAVSVASAACGVENTG